MTSKQTIFLLLSWLSFGRCFAQPNEYLFSHLDFSNGLSNSHVTSIYKDGKGFMWFGTVSGLDRFDGYQFKPFRHDARNARSLTDNYIEQIFEGPEGKMWVEARAGRFNIYDFARDQFDSDYPTWLRTRGLPESWLLNIVKAKKGFWFVYRDQGIYHYMPDGKVIAMKPGAELSAALIGAAREDSYGNLWVVHQDGQLEKVDASRHKVTYRTDLVAKDLGNDHIMPLNIFIDGEDDVWLSSNGVFKGAYYFRPSTEELRHFALDAGERKLNNNVVYSIMQDGKGLIWLATDHGGINVVDKRDLSVSYITHVEDDGKSVSENSITSLFRDNLGTIWAGTFKSGISYYHQSRFQFPQYRHEPHQPGSLSYDDVNNFVEDATGNIWIASNGGGLIYFNRRTNTFRQYLHEAGNKNTLSNNIVVSLLLDKDGKLWIGTYFGGLDCFDGQRFTHYRHDDRDSNSLAEDRVMYIYEDSDRQLWVGTLAEGLDRMDRKKGAFYHYKYGRPGSIRNPYVSCIAEDAQKNLWVATGYGIDVLERSTGRFVHYSMDSSRLSSDNVILLMKDSRQRMWAATREGLNLFLPEKKMFQSFSTEDGLPHNTIRSIQEDKRHDLWISTPNGLSRIQVSQKQDGTWQIHCRNFHEQDGLQGREFNERAGLVTKDGMLIFGGPNGFNIFHPEDIVPTGKTPPIALTGLEIFNKPVHVGDTVGGHVILQKDLTETSAITLHYKDKVFSIEFASLGFIYNARNKYAYTLEGFTRNWLTTDGAIRKATYTNLDAGEYTFRVKASDEDGEWYDQEATLKIVVLPPFWKTPLAYFVYLLLLAGVLYIARRMVLQRARMRFALEQERRETRRMHEMDLVKIKFFTNMSHELRTPLSLILAPVDRLLEQPEPAGPRKQYEMIRRNAKRLLHLVDQLLDFRKMEVNELRLHLRQGDVVRFVRDIYGSFIDLAEKKNISFSYQEDRRSLITQFDHDKLERILFNLLSNAFKFTPENGSVHVSITTEQKGDEVWLSIRIRDTGIGIAPDKQERIFERFFQSDVPETILNQGSGIGLSITQEFVRMHNGRLTVESELNKGSCFTVSLPCREQAAPESLLLPAPAAATETIVETRDVTTALQGIAEEATESAQKSTILIIEDNEDFRFYLKDNLRAHYRIIEATDGKEGWRKVLAAHPHLVVSDISMPAMDGIQLCKKIKNDERTRQIPVILLTAMAGEGSEVRGLATGATDYITKPFNFEVLLSKIRNTLDHQEVVRKTYQRQVQAQPTSVEVASADDIFMREVLEQIEKNMGNPDFSVGELSMQFHASRSTFYKRLLLLTGKTPVELIRHIRLQRAAELLEKSQLTVAEIAYTVGFNNPKYFAQYFKTEFNMIPSAYRSEKKGK